MSVTNDNDLSHAKYYCANKEQEESHIRSLNSGGKAVSDAMADEAHIESGVVTEWDSSKLVGKVSHSHGSYYSFTASDLAQNQALNVGARVCFEKVTNRSIKNICVIPSKYCDLTAKVCHLREKCCFLRCIFGKIFMPLSKVRDSIIDNGMFLATELFREDDELLVNVIPENKGRHECNLFAVDVFLPSMRHAERENSYLGIVSQVLDNRLVLWSKDIGLTVAELDQSNSASLKSVKRGHRVGFKLTEHKTERSASEIKVFNKALLKVAVRQGAAEVKVDKVNASKQRVVDVVSQKKDDKTADAALTHSDDNSGELVLCDPTKPFDIWLHDLPTSIGFGRGRVIRSDCDMLSATSCDFVDPDDFVAVAEPASSNTNHRLAAHCSISSFQDKLDDYRRDLSLIWAVANSSIAAADEFNANYATVDAADQKSEQLAKCIEQRLIELAFSDDTISKLLLKSGLHSELVRQLFNDDEVFQVYCQKYSHLIRQFMMHQ